MIVGGTWLSTNSASVTKVAYTNAGTLIDDDIRTNKQALLVYPYWSSYKIGTVSTIKAPFTLSDCKSERDFTL